MAASFKQPPPFQSAFPPAHVVPNSIFQLHLDHLETNDGRQADSKKGI